MASNDPGQPAAWPRLDRRDRPSHVPLKPRASPRKRGRVVRVLFGALCLGGIVMALPVSRERPSATPSTIAAREDPAPLVRQGAKAPDVERTGRPFPIHDVDAVCREFGQNRSYPEKYCLREEQRSYDFLRAVWPRLTEKTYRNCIRLYKPDGPSPYRYGAVAECVLIFMPIDEIHQQGSFKR